ncbi:accelerated cell death 11-like [Vitis riparia]|uniref:accelerated cell death 11-like n=1 Tax=Vitis riparia TaxID=96939 RepID=UPI00155A9A80|nr:accelerated cell death 11-like [Vitis riparia]
MAKNSGILTTVADAFSEVAQTVNSPRPYVEIGRLVRACRLLSPLLSSLGVFKFAEKEFSAKVDDLAEAAKSVHTLESLLDSDIRKNCEKDSNSHSRNLVRVKRSVDMLKIMFEQILARGGNSIVGPVSTAYKQVFAPYHGWLTRTGVSAAMITLPTKAQLLRNLNEDEATANVQMQKYVTASASVLQYIDKLFRSRRSGNELLGMV